VSLGVAQIAVMHSGSSDAERHRMWRGLRSGELRIAVGARSALFAPVSELGLICVDEEHDGSFKQEEGVRYHARDMALLRAHRAGAVCVLGSATPSLSSIALVREGRLLHLSLPARARAASILPSVEVVDLRRVGSGIAGEKLLSLPLTRALEDVLKAKQQAILFLFGGLLALAWRRDGKRLLVFAATETDQDIRFAIYDPNAPDKPAVLSYNRGSRAFSLPINFYFPGGRVHVYEIYHRCCY